MMREVAQEGKRAGVDWCCIEAPIFDANGAVLAPLGLSGLVSQMDTRRREAFGKLVRSYGRQESARLGWVDGREAAADK